ncbi:UDP-glucose 4-epimerase GalE [Curvibacter sp. HBC61]|uniref:UDP-glucose 4-epimerase n=1 Tax=Curvibacter cyanobacteriorum TaxID=3026422 RepID=A0ABT5N6U9_9BURK|nr:UDP-glucose 4-epimerase GalE [Curvibacter sp. HBC61]MDD0840862.1 UDP-glucose 4-epimerase GalE [Curvibacter sp. HBC61]
MILLTGGTGYIASHTAVALAQAGWRCVLLDNLANSPASTVQALTRITGSAPVWVQGDVRDGTLLDDLLARYPIQAVVHAASLKAVGEGGAQPSLYYDSNVSGTLSLLQAMQRAGLRRLVFSSSSTVYGNPSQTCLDENAPLAPLSPEARTKVMVEQILTDVAASHPDWRITSLRCFNPVGAHPSGLLGEAPRGQTLNLLTVMAQAAARQRPPLSLFGNDYPTPDGTGVRDYIHVMDLGQGHLAALRQMLSPEVDGSSGQGAVPRADGPAAASAAAAWPQRYQVLNLGRGQGVSVLQLLQAFEQHTGQRVPYQVAPRRLGDAACWFADTRRAQHALGWQAELGLAEMCTGAWRWQQRSHR